MQLPLTLGAIPTADGVTFRVWAPEARHVEVVLLDPRDQVLGSHALLPGEDGNWQLHVPGVQPGERYAYRVDGHGPFPDPASRFQPEGVHGPSAIVDPSQFQWTDAQWPGCTLDGMVLYELHVGTFTPEGTFAGVAAKLPYLRDLGVTAIELLPVADFPGRWNWGYDGVALFAPARCYGTPDDFRRLVDEAHRLGLAVLLDVVYNHHAPDGNYLGVYSPYYRSPVKSPWGDCFNFDGPHSGHVRRFFVENALAWLREYHLDGLRLDATHMIHDAGARHFLAELQATLRAGVSRPIVLIAEDLRNLAHNVHLEDAGGYGLDAVWSDDFHHELHRYLTGEDESYYADHRGTLADLATILRQGWLFTGQESVYWGGPHGSDPAGLALGHVVTYIQNHDQVGNRARGERLSHLVLPRQYAAAAAVLLFSGQTPMLFMGEEWAASSPFLFFTDHKPELGRLITEGRRRDFARFRAFRDAAYRESIPDPQDPRTFESSRLQWEEITHPDHAAVLELYSQLIRLRRTEPALRSHVPPVAVVQGDHTLTVRRDAPGHPSLLLVASFAPEEGFTFEQPSGGDWGLIFHAPGVSVFKSQP